MRLPRIQRGVFSAECRGLFALLLLGVSFAACSAQPAHRPDCVGYYTLDLPGEVEYAVHQPNPVFAHPNTDSLVLVERSIFQDVRDPRFADGLSVWGSYVTTTSETTKAELAILANWQNFQGEKTKAALLKKVERFADSPEMHQSILDSAAAIRSYKPFNDGTVYAVEQPDEVSMLALIGNRIVDATWPKTGTVQQVIDAFLATRRPRAVFEIPSEPGVCLAYQFHRARGTQPADVAVSMRLKDRPDIVIYLRDQPVDTSDEAPASAEAFIKKAVHPNTYFYATELTQPLDGKVRSFRSITIDGREGLGAFALVTRKVMQGTDAVHNESNKNQDWAYIAYVPGDKKAPMGLSSDLTFRVERFGRFATQLMTEKEFRELVKTIAVSIKRRPGAWRAQ